MRSRLAIIRRDPGFTLVEMLVAILIIGVALTVMARVLGLSIKTQLGQERLTSGTQVANAELEKMQGLPWRELGFYTDDNPPSAPSGKSYVILGLTRGTDVRALTPTGTVTVTGGSGLGSNVYTIRRNVYWYDNPATNTQNDYKQLEVVVTWTGTSGAVRTVTADSIRSPKGSEQTPADFSLRSFTATPYGAGLDGAGATVGRLSQNVVLALETTAAANSASVVFTDRTGTVRTLAMAQTTDNRHFAVPLNTGTYYFNNGDNSFSFTANRSSPASSVTSAKVTRLLEPFVPATPALAPSSFCATAANSTAVAVSVFVQGATVDDAVSVSYGSAGATVAAVFQASDTNGATFVATLPAGGVAATSNVTATATRGTPALGSTPQSTAVVTVNSAC